VHLAGAFAMALVSMKGHRKKDKAEEGRHLPTAALGQGLLQSACCEWVSAPSG